MRNGIILAALVLTLMAFVAMMQVKTEVQTMDTQRQQLVKQRGELRETKRVLEAEWALLASPGKLQQIADRAGKTYINGTALAYVPLVPVSPTQPSPTAPRVAAPAASAAVSPSESVTPANPPPSAAATTPI